MFSIRFCSLNTEGVHTVYTAFLHLEASVGKPPLDEMLSMGRTVTFLANAKYENLVPKISHIFLANSQVIIEQFQLWVCLNCGFLEIISHVHLLIYPLDNSDTSFHFYQSNAYTYFKKSNSTSGLKNITAILILNSAPPKYPSHVHTTLGFPGGSDGKQGDQGSIPGSGRSS